MKQKTKIILSISAMIIIFFALYYLIISLVPLETTTTLSISGYSDSSGVNKMSDKNTQQLATIQCSAPGYEYCSEAYESYSYNCATAVANPKLVYDPAGFHSKIKNGYYIKEARVSYGCLQGGKATYVLNGNPITSNDCPDARCPGTSIPDIGTLKIASKGDSQIPAINIYCLEENTNFCGSYWANAWAWVAWRTEGYSAYVVECYDNDDCEQGYECNKEGDWNAWHCEENLCANVECNNYCENGINFYGGTCNKNTGSCEYIQQKCAVEDSCMNDFKRKYNSRCENNVCKFAVETCTYGCEDGVCIEGECQNNDTITKECKYGYNYTTHICQDNYWQETNETCKGSNMLYIVIGGVSILLIFIYVYRKTII